MDPIPPARGLFPLPEGAFRVRVRAMVQLEELLTSVSQYLPLVFIILIVVVGIRIIQWLWLGKRINQFSDRKIIPQLLMLAFVTVGAILMILALPISETLRGNILSLLGLVLTGVMALSSTTFVANAFAGSMLRLTRCFRIGDYIKVEGKGGRVTERGIFHTEIQTEDRDLTTFPNLYLVTNPVTVVRASGTIISATVSLGYDVHHTRVEALLMEAAKKVNLTDPFVHVLELGDFSVTYKVSGFLEDTKSLLTARSMLRQSMLDCLHDARIEIVSPNFMNQRPQPEGRVFIPESAIVSSSNQAVPEKTAEEIAFDKAEDAEIAAAAEAEESPEAEET